MVTLIELDFLSREIHYGPYSRYWWELPSLPNREGLPYFPIRIGQKTYIYLNERNFYITIQCETFSNIASSPSAAISNVYEKIFHNKTRYSGLLVMGWTNEDIIKKLSKSIDFIPISVMVGTYKVFLYSVGSSDYTPWQNAGDGYKSSLIHSFGKKVAVFVSKIEKQQCILQIYQELHICKTYIGTTPDDVWKNSGLIQKYKGQQLFGLDDQTIQQILYQHRIPTCKPDDWNDYKKIKILFDYHLKRRTIANINWHDFFVTWLQEKITIIELSSRLESIYPVAYEFTDREKSAWRSFLRAAGCTNVTPWSQEESEINILFTIMIGQHLISESRKHGRKNGYGAPPPEKPIFTRLKFKAEMLNQFDRFFSDKAIINMSSYKSDTSTGLPTLYLQDYKKVLWERFHEQYPNGIKRTSFMTRLQGGRYVYKDNLGGLCSECNECGYEVFGDIRILISAHIDDENLKKKLLVDCQVIRRYMRRDYSKNLQVSSSGVAQHSSYISHCLKFAFGSCNLPHTEVCNNCENLFLFLKNLKTYLPSEFHESLNNYKRKLISWMAHHARKTYLNTYVQVSLDELDNNGAVCIVDYKMKILLQTVLKTKQEWFGKCDWTMHSILMYTKDMENNQLNIQAFDHWSDDTKQDAWFTASSLHAALNTLEKKPKWITILSDNGPHYHCTELMIIMGQWKDWYQIIPKQWIFLEAGEAKTAIDSHHSQISQAIKRYIKLGSDIESGEDIEEAIKNITGTHVAHLVPNRSTGTITGIRNFQQWTWPVEGENEGYIFAQVMPEIGTWKKWLPNQITKISKKRTFEKPNPTVSDHTEPTKLWKIPLLESQVINTEYNNEINNYNTLGDQIEQTNMDKLAKMESNTVFVLGWALKENQKFGKRDPIKRITPQIKKLLEIMFHSGTANPRQKMSAQQMHTNLLERVENNEIEADDVPKISTIANWISGFSRQWKTAMAERSLKEEETLIS
ncbi:hypothetical protein Glove_294g79 [Diversispora epigaea]|uniref:Uncharacterized protein n=1 Tax=Diversispora epigaea TaxID=1348612 RepID=A0A397HZ96_9GLOM|nr:hypothetical protein Glove_294g79 [Diversispora epigaea]